MIHIAPPAPPSPFLPGGSAGVADMSASPRKPLDMLAFPVRNQPPPG
jgi:hypothetical protein